MRALRMKYTSIQNKIQTALYYYYYDGDDDDDYYYYCYATTHIECGMRTTLGVVSLISLI